ncbi:MAG TPA: hypothetical protein PKA10_20090 [Selenomonadales bacterium]|nr:hypothetical protein [Selenomonadales bacterium]
MKCAICGRELGREEKCPSCRPEPAQEVQILTPEEQEEDFRGMPLDNEAAKRAEQEEGYRYDGREPRQRIYVRQISFGSGMGIWTKLLIMLVLGVLVFVVLPLAFFVIAGVSLAWLILRLLRR